jgi:hypothetical protein
LPLIFLFAFASAKIRYDMLSLIMSGFPLFISWEAKCDVHIAIGSHQAHLNLLV